MVRAKVIITIIAVMAVVALFGCAKKSVKLSEAPDAQKVTQNGVGKARNFDDALNTALAHALQKVVEDIVGPENEKNNREKLDSYMYSIPRTFILRYQVTDKVKSGRETVVYARAVFNKDKVIESISTLEIAIPEKKKTTEEVYAELPQAPLIREAIDNLTYLVYFEPEKKNIKDGYARLCVNRVNNYLAARQYEYVDLERITEAKQEHFKLYRETQGTVSVVQLIAQALNADVYIVVDGAVEFAGKKSGVYFASASIALKAFESATGRGLGAETGYSGELGLPSGEDAAKRKCVEVAVEKAIEPVIRMAREYMAKAYEKGIRYEVVIQGFGDYRMLEGFTDAIRNTSSFRSLKEVSAARDQAKYYVYYMGRKSELIDDIMNNVQNTEGFENLSVVVSRGNAVVFGVMQ
ncbi:MAG: DUF6175 family protein [Spirochaetota bacterium]